METAALRDGKPLVIVSTGDNIYPDGVYSADDPQWKTKYENIYTTPTIKDLSWVAVLGNHDHRKSITAQVDYGKTNPKWIMPSPYFSHRLKAPDETTVSLLCLDTQQVLQQKEGWEDQVKWFKDELPKHHESDWRIVVGHHPMRSYGHYGDQAFMLEHFKPLFDAHGVNAYLCGHDHDLQIIKNPDDKFHCIVSGGGGGSRKTHVGKDTLASSTNGGFVNWLCDKKSATAQIMNADGVEVRMVQIKKDVVKK